MKNSGNLVEKVVFMSGEVQKLQKRVWDDKRGGKEVRMKTKKKEEREGERENEENENATWSATLLGCVEYSFCFEKMNQKEGESFLVGGRERREKRRIRMRYTELEKRERERERN